jgi:hypothetical protein
MQVMKYGEWKLQKILVFTKNSILTPHEVCGVKTKDMTLISSQALLNCLEQTTERHIQKAIELSEHGRGPFAETCRE